MWIVVDYVCQLLNAVSKFPLILYDENKNYSFIAAAFYAGIWPCRLFLKSHNFEALGYFLLEFGLEYKLRVWIAWNLFIHLKEFLTNQLNFI